MSHRLNLSKSGPKLYQAMGEFEKLAKEAAENAGIAPGLGHLLRLRASQINGCAYCVRMHTQDALSTGESIERISVLPAWRETGYFTPKERAALALVEAITNIADGQIPDAVYEEAASHLNESEISAIEWATITINAWNRIAIASRYPVGP